MARLPLLLALAVSQALAAPARAAESALLPGADGDPCTRDGRWCAGLEEADEEGVVRPVLRAADAPRAPRRPAEEVPGGEADSVWPVLIPLGGGGFLAGVRSRSSTSYSGGGGGVEELRLYRMDADGRAGAGPVLDLPMDANLTIRACFGERDRRNRRGACQDEYHFGATLRVEQGGEAGWPVLIYATEATAFPRGVSRMADSTRMAALTAKDLVRQRVGRCSYARRFRYDAAAGAYRPDAPLPDCSDFTEP